MIHRAEKGGATVVLRPENKSWGYTGSFTDPDGHVMELYYEAERYAPPERLRPSLKNQPQRYTGRGAAIKRLDHVNLLAEDVRANRDFAEGVLGYRLYERIELDDGSEAGAWLSLSIAASPSGSIPARRFSARPTSSSTTRWRSRPPPPSTPSRRDSSSTGSSPVATGSR